MLVVALRRGEELVAATFEVLSAHGIGHAWIVGRGTLDEVELEDAGARRSYITPSRIVALEGHAAAGAGSGKLVLSATVARSTPRGPELLCGELVRAIAHDAELLVTPFEPLAEQSAGEESTRDEASPAAEPATPAQPRAVANDPWAAVAAASSSSVSAAAPKARIAPPAASIALAPPLAPPAPPRRRMIEEETYPEPGDLLDHFAFGRCIVVRSDGDELLVQHPASGRTRTIRLSALQAAPPIDEEGKRLFKLTQRRL